MDGLSRCLSCQSLLRTHLLISFLDDLGAGEKIQQAILVLFESLKKVAGERGEERLYCV